MYLIGGTDDKSVDYPNVLLYDANLDEFVPNQIPPMGIPEVPRFGHVAVLVGSQILIMGGSTHSPAADLRDVQILQLPSQGVSPSWTTGCPLPSAMPNAAAAVTVLQNGTAIVHVMGSSSADIALDHVTFVIYDPTTRIICPGSTLSPVEVRQGVKATLMDIAESKLKTMTNDDDYVAVSSSSSKKTGKATKLQTMTNDDDDSVISSSPNDLSWVRAASYIGQGFITPFGTYAASTVFDPLCPLCFLGQNSLNGVNLPDGIQINNIRACGYVSEVLQAQDAVSLQTSFSESISIKVHFDIPFIFQHSFSSNEEFKTIETHMWQHNDKFVQAVAECVGFELQHDGKAAAISRGMSRNFVTAIMDAPETVTPDTTASLVKILQEFGDTVVTGLNHGAKLTQTFRMTSSNYSVAMAASLNFDAAASASILHIFGESKDVDVSIDVKLDEWFSSFTSTNYSECVPSCPPHSPDVASNSSVWAQTIMDMANSSGAPIRFVLRPLTDFVDPAYFPSSAADHVAKVRAALLTVISNGAYCDSMPGCHVPKAQPYWTMRRNQTIPLQYSSSAFASSTGLLYVSGGYYQSAAFGTMFTFNTSDAQANWLDVSPLNEARYNHSLVAVGAGQLVALGGFTAAKQTTQSVEVYDTAKGLWTQGPDMKLPLAQTGAVALPQSVVVVGGIAWTASPSSSSINCVAHLLDLPSMTWSIGFHQIPESCVLSPGVGVANGMVYVFGGTFHDGSCSNNVLVYDATKDFWSVRYQMPMSYCSVSVTQQGSFFYVVAGDEAYVFDTTTSEFTMLSSPPFGSSGTAVQLDTANGEIVLVGGPYQQVLKNIPLPSDQESEEQAIKAKKASELADVKMEELVRQNKQQQKQMAKKNKKTKVTSSGSEQMMTLDVDAVNVNAKQQQQQQQQQQKQQPKQKKNVKSSAKADGVPFPYAHLMSFGYHTLFADPLSHTGDPGWSRQSVFNATSSLLNWTTPMYVPGDMVNWVLPDKMDWASFEAADCRYASEAYTIHDTVDLQKVFASKRAAIPVAKWGWPGFLGYEYSASATWQNVLSAQAELDAVLELSIGMCKRYQLSFDMANPPFALTDAFVEDLSNLPTEVTPNTTAQLLDFVNR